MPPRTDRCAESNTSRLTSERLPPPQPATAHRNHTSRARDPATRAARRSASACAAAAAAAGASHSDPRASGGCDSSTAGGGGGGGIVGAWCGCGSGSGANESNVPCRAVPRPSSRPRASRWTILRRAAGGTLGFVPQRCPPPPPPPPPRRRSMQCGAASQRRQASHAMARAVARGAPPAAGPSRPPLSLALPCLLCMPRRCLSRWLAGHLVSCYLYGSTAS